MPHELAPQYRLVPSPVMMRTTNDWQAGFIIPSSVELTADILDKAEKARVDARLRQYSRAAPFKPTIPIAPQLGPSSAITTTAAPLERSH